MTTRTDLEEILESSYMGYGQCDYSEALEAMVDAYNRGISDAVNEISKPSYQVELGVANAVLKLKIRS